MTDDNRAHDQTHGQDQSQDQSQDQAWSDYDEHIFATVYFSGCDVKPAKKRQND